ncbi:catalase family protein [Muricoccus radiodurans]|uniref:catalase family protein n=1 Tax=Muricoccus radiodurans TaxID=2231721 RepID=UPI003CF81F4B
MRLTSSGGTGRAPSRAPLPYDSGIEHAEPDEARTAARLRAMMRDIRETTLRHTGHAQRGLHTKSHGLLEGELRVPDGLPTPLAQGLFARAGRYPVILRLSTNRPDVLDDDISVPRGLSIKVIGVEGERLEGSEGSTTQDFVLVNQPFFTEPDLRVFARNIRFVDATTQTGLAWKKTLAAALRPVVAAVRAFGGTAPTLTTLGGHPLTHPLGETYFSQVPFRHGDYVAKLCLTPASPELRALRNAPVRLRGRPNGLRQAVIDFFRTQGGEWELRAQLRTDPATMPIEDASAQWPESESPYLTLARIVVPPQPAWNEARARRVDDGLAFNPWNGLAAHRPLGSVNRARRQAYAQSSAFRAEHNRCPIHEPVGRPALPGDPPETYGTDPGREGRRRGTPDALPGRWATPMRPTAQALHAVVLGALVLTGGGLVRSAIRPVLPRLLLAGALGWALRGLAWRPPQP